MLRPMVSVVVDERERPSGVPALLESFDDVDLTERRLPSGDYDVGNGALVERKTVRDLHLTIINGRFWRQLRAIRSAPWPYLVVEGTSLDAGPLDPNAVRGVLIAASDLGTIIVQTRGPRDTALWLYRIALRRRRAAHRDRPTYAQRPKSIADTVPEAVLAAIPGISVHRARALLAKFGTVRAVADATRLELTAVAGVGEQTATSIVAAFTSHSRLSGNGQIPST
jgi:ERCC4-type nuclease